MSQRKWLLGSLIAISLTTSLGAQSASGILDSSRAIDWTSAGAPIPTRGTVCATLGSPGQAPSYAQSTTSSDINSAITNCPAGQVVFLNAGTYTLSAGFTMKGVSNVTVRGAGPTQTILSFTGGNACDIASDVCMDANSGLGSDSATVQPGQSNACTWTSGYGEGTRTITLSACGLTPTVGALMVLDQIDDSSDTGGLTVCVTAGVCRANTTGNYVGRETPHGSNVVRDQMQVVRITSVSGTGTFTVGITPGVYPNNIRAGQSPGAWFPNSVVGDGIENLTLDHSRSSYQNGISLSHCFQCYVKNVRSLFTELKRNHAILTECAHCVIRDSYFFKSDGATKSYGIELNGTSDSLIENNIFSNIASPILVGQSMGSVIAFNYSYEGFYENPNFMQYNYDGHNAGSSFNLWEGNQFEQAISTDNVWGTTSLGTIFRNRISGSQLGKIYQTVPIELDSWARGYSFVGNVFGTAGFHTQYESYPPSTGHANCYKSIYLLGWAAENCQADASWPNVLNDPLVRNTSLRWGNYDVVTGTVQWNASEVPTVGVPYINGNPVPASHSLPTSFYLAAQPSWWQTAWSTPPWPATGPDVTGGSGPGGHSYAVPAAICATNTGVDQSYRVTYPITSASWSGGVATVTVGNNVLTSGLTVTVTGVNPSGYNGKFEVTNRTSNTVSYALSANPGNYVSGGSFTWPNILSFDATACYVATNSAPPVAPPISPSNVRIIP